MEQTEMESAYRLINQTILQEKVCFRHTFVRGSSLCFQQIVYIATSVSGSPLPGVPESWG